MTQFTKRNPNRRRVRPPSLPPRGTATASGVVVATTAVTLTNTTSETNLASLQLPADSFTAGRVAVLDTAGSFSHTTSTGDVIFRFKINSQTAIQTPALSPTTSTDPRAWMIRGTLIASSSQEQFVSALMEITPDSTDTWKVSNWSGDGFDGVGYATTTQPSTAAIDVKVTAQLSNATTGWVITAQGAFLEQVR